MKNLSHVIGYWQIAKLDYYHIVSTLSITAVAHSIRQGVGDCLTICFMYEHSSIYDRELR